MPDQAMPPGLVNVDEIPISVLILTLNERQNITRCIEALDWSDDIVVLDSFSTDGTQQLASELGARVHERQFDDFAGQRNYALDNIEFKHQWLLHLDADEVVTKELRDELSAVLKKPQYRVFKIPSKLMFQGKWLRHSGLYPSYQVRFAHIDALRFEQVGHGQREGLETEAVGTLDNPYLHYNFSKGMADWIERHNRYSTDEARQGLTAATEQHTGWIELLRMDDKTARRRALKVKVSGLPFRPLLRFIYMYIFRKGFLDGRAGYSYCRLSAMYEYWTVLKMREFRKKAKSAL